MTSPDPQDADSGWPAAICPDEREFHTEEYKIVRRMLEASYARFQQMPVLAALGSVAVFSWLVTQKVEPSYGLLAVFAWLLPFFLTLFLLFASRAHFRTIKLYGAYSARLEKHLGSPSIRGWQDYFDNCRRVEEPQWPKHKKATGTWVSQLKKWDKSFYDDKYDEPWDAGTRVLTLWFFLPLLALDLLIGVIGIWWTLGA